MQTQLDDMRNDIDQVRGSIELHNHQLEKLLEDGDGAFTDSKVSEIQKKLEEVDIDSLEDKLKDLNKKQEIKVDASALEDFEEQLELVLMQIMNDDFVQTDMVSACEWCDYKAVCKR